MYIDVPKLDVHNSAMRLYSVSGLMQAEPATALSLIRVGALQNATAAEPENGQFVLSKTELIALICGVDHIGEPLELMQAEPAIATSLIRAGVLQNAIAAGPGSDVGRTCNCFGSDTGWCLQNATAAELGAAQTYSVAVKWKSLTPGRFKCNIDTSFVSHLNRVGIA
ncbi:hypothetical protein QL285_007282 [Trifolium repens]|nr:hypothetical protein QL285_007282 [Trifolium repens]